MRISLSILTAVLIFGIAGCTHIPGEITASKDRNIKSPYLNIMLGRYEENQGNWTKALEHYAAINDPFAWLSQARIYFILNQNRNALDIIQRLVDEGTYGDEALELRTKINARNGNWLLAIADTEILIKKNPDNYQLKLFLANLKIIMSDFNGAIEILDDMLEANEDTMVWYTMSKACLGQKDFNCAKDALIKAIEIQPEFTQAYLDLGRTYELLDKRSEAIEVYEELLEFEPFSPEAHIALAEYYISEKQYKDAIVHLKTLLEVKPNMELLRRLVMIELQEGLYTDAIDLLMGIDEITVKDKYYMAIAYTGLERFEDALGMLDEIPKEGTTGCDAILLQSSILKDTGKIPEAIDVLENAWRHYSQKETCNDIGYQLATELDNAGERERALEVALKMYEKDSQDPVVLNFIGYVWADQGINIDRAYVMIQEALKSKPSDVYILDSMAWVLFRMNKPEEALGYMEKAVEQLVDDPIINEHMGDILSSLGRNEEALNYYLKSSVLYKRENKGLEEKINKLLK